MISRLSKELTRLLTLLPCFLLPWVMLTSSMLRFGPWPYSQPPFIVLILLCFFLSVGLSLCAFLNNIEEFHIEFNYASAICLGIAVWSCITAYFSYIPWLSWTGSPQLGMGIVWYIALSVMIIGYKLILNSKYLYPLIINLVISSFTISYLIFIGNLRHGLVPALKWNPYFINEHIVFIGIPLIGLGLLLDNKNYRKMLAILGIFIVMASTNKTAFVGITVGVFLSGIAYYINKKENFLSVSSRYFFAAFIFLIPLFVYLMAKCISSDYFFLSLHTRYHFWRTCIDALFNNPIRILTGFGWGSYTDIMLSSIHKIPPQVILPDMLFHLEEFLIQHLPIPKSWNEIGLNIDTLLGGEVGFHSHNQFIETLIATGIIGELLYSILLILPVLLCKKSKLASMIFCSTALSFTLSGWYELPGTLPYLAIFLAFAIPNTSIYEIKFKNFLQYAMPCISIILLVFGLSLCYLNLRFDEVREKFSSNKPEKILAITAQDFIESSSPGGAYFSIFLRNFLNAVHFRPLTAVDIEVLHKLLEASQQINPSLVMLSSELPVYDFLMNKTQDPRLNNLKNTLMQKKWWETSNSTLVRRWYTRADLMLPYFDWLLQHGQIQRAREIIKNILAKHGDNPILQNYLKGLDEIPTV